LQRRRPLSRHIAVAAAGPKVVILIASPTLPAEDACALLCEAGFPVSSSDIRIERRDERWAVTLPGDQMAWFPAGDAGRERLAVERRALRLLSERCTFRVPRVLFEHHSGFDVRAIVAGVCDPWPLFERTKTDHALARRIGHGIGTILAEQHTRIFAGDVAGWLPERVSWPEPADAINHNLAEIVDDGALRAAVAGVLESYETIAVDPTDRVLVHADLGLHNVVMRNDFVAGVFDYDGAAWADRHHDFRYLVLHNEGEPVLEAALAVYEPMVGQRLNRERIFLYNAVCAIGFLASRRGVPADERWCGRTLAEDLGWVRGAPKRLAAMLE
jgi:hypothetical protein